ncbi:MAG TPA: 4Fe-4S dicluster domain-containing protein, partial [Anaerolineaceae bacterium]|nr:4Fe-4S dicluster domain-containing protein [Anaerolineaceae bacterium]
ETCITFGGIAERLIQNGRLRKVTRRDVFTIKAEAEDAGLVTLMLAANLKPDVAGISSGMACSCCSDCCYALKVIRDFNAPGIVAAPHFRPNIKALACTACGRCVSVCPVSALTIDPVSRKLVINPQRCIGCGLCSRTCARHAIEMRPVPNYHHPPQTALGLAAHALPNFARNVWRIWRRRTRRDAPASER